MRLPGLCPRNATAGGPPPANPAYRMLASHSAGTHPQKAEYPVDDVEQHATHGNSAYVGGRTQMADDGYINQAEQRHGDVRYNGRQGYLQYLSVSGLHLYYLIH